MTGMMAPQVDGTMEEVPPGALPEEVADDIPAAVSEGEYILPADVVRYHGLKSLLLMQMEAKEALAAMEEDGLLGGSPVALEGGFAGAEPVTEELPEPIPEAPIDPTAVQGFAAGGTPLPDDIYTQAANQFRTDAPTLSKYLENMSGRVGYTYGQPGEAVTAGGDFSFAPRTPTESATPKPLDYSSLMNPSAAGAPKAPTVQNYEGGGPGDDSGDPNHGAGVHEMDPNKSFGENLADWGGKVGYGVTAAGAMMSPMAAMTAMATAALTDKPVIDGTLNGTLGKTIGTNIRDITNMSNPGGYDGPSSMPNSINDPGALSVDQMRDVARSVTSANYGFATNPGMAGGGNNNDPVGQGPTSTQSVGTSAVGAPNGTSFSDHGNYGGREDSISFGGWGGYNSSSPGTSGGGGGADGNNGAGGSSDNRVICTHFYRKGELDRALWVADTRWTMLHVSEHTQRGYQLWGVPYVRLMRKYKLAETIVRPLALHRANEIAYQLGMRDKPDYIGKLGRVILEGISWFAGWLPFEPISYKTLYTK